MKKFLLLLFVSAFFSVSLLSQKKARVLLNDINGKISKAEVEFIEYYENSSGDWVRTSFFEKQIFYFDNDQNLIKREELRDYTRTDYKKKPKPTVTVTPAKRYQEPVEQPRKADTSIVQTEKGEIMTLTYENGSTRVIGKQNSAPYHTISTSMNEKGRMTYRVEYRKDGSRESEIIFSDKPGSDTSWISMYDEHDNQVKFTPYENNKIDQSHARKSSYYYDSYGNIERYVNYKWNTEAHRWRFNTEWEYKYHYIKDSGSKEKATAKTAETDAVSEEAVEPKEKKTLKEKLNVFKKKD